MGAVIRSQQIPISQRISTELSPAERLQKAISDGEDFELLFTVSPEEGQRLLKQNPLEIALTHLGEITAEQEAFLLQEDGSRISLKRSGWQHQL